MRDPVPYSVTRAAEEPAVVSLRTSGAPAPARERWSWAVYEFAHTIFSMNVATLYFTVWLVADLHVSSTAVALTGSMTAIAVALSLPLFGALSDARQRRVPWVTAFTVISFLGTFLLGVLGYRLSSGPLSGLALGGLLVAYAVANYAYQGALPFYNAMLTELTPAATMGRLTGMAAVLGYLGSIIGVVLVSPFFNGHMPLIGALPGDTVAWLRHLVPYTSQEGRVSTFVPTALLYLLFSLPLLFLGRDHRRVKHAPRVGWRAALRGVLETVRDLRRYPGAGRYLLASMAMQDAMGTIVSFMAIFAVKAKGFAAGAEVTLFVVLTVPAVIGSWVAGRLVDRVGPKRTLTWTVWGWVLLLFALIALPGQASFWAVGLCIGFIFGGVSVAERPMMLRLIPAVEAGRVFSLMVLSARAAAVVGPVMWALTVDGLSPIAGVGVAYRAAVGTVILAMVFSLVLLRGVREPAVAPESVFPPMETT